MASKNPGATLLPWLGIATLVIVLDQLTKTLILQTFQLNDSHTAVSYTHLTLPTKRIV